MAPAASAIGAASNSGPAVTTSETSDNINTTAYTPKLLREF